MGWCRERAQSSGRRSKRRSWFAGRKPSCPFWVKISYLFHCNEWHFLLGDRSCWSSSPHYCTLARVRFPWGFSPFASWGSCRRWSFHSDKPSHENAFGFRRTCSQHLSSLLYQINTLYRRFWDREARLLHPVGWHWSSHLHKGRANRSCILGRVVVDDYLFYFHEVGSESLLVDSSFDVPRSRMMPTPPRNHNQVEDSPLELYICIKCSLLMCLQKPWITAIIHFLHCKLW